MGATLVLTRRDVPQLLGLDDCIAAVEAAFRLHAKGRSLSPGVLAVAAPEGGFHIKAAEPGRRSDHEIKVFDSTGTALEDVAAAAVVYERAVAAGRGLSVDLGA